MRQSMTAAVRTSGEPQTDMKCIVQMVWSVSITLESEAQRRQTGSSETNTTATYSESATCTYDGHPPVEPNAQ